MGHVPSWDGRAMFAVRLLLRFHTLSALLQTNLSVLRYISLTPASQKQSFPSQPPPARMPCGRAALIRGEKAMQPVPASRPERTWRQSPVSALNSFTVESWPPLRVVYQHTQKDNVRCNNHMAFLTVWSPFQRIHPFVVRLTVDHEQTPKTVL